MKILLATDDSEYSEAAAPFGHFGGGFGFGVRRGSVGFPRHGVGRVGGRFGTRHR